MTPPGPDGVGVRRPVEVYTQLPAGGGWACGSGYLLAPRLVLTAAHFVCPTSNAAPAATVQIRAQSGGLMAAKVVWHCYRGEIDVALLEITDPAWVEPGWRHPVRWGRMVTSRPRQECQATGFPAVVATPQMRDSHAAQGLLNPGSLVKAGLYAVEVTNPPAGPTADGSRWQGMSGAAVVCPDPRGGELVVGVVTKDPAGFDSRRLITMPVTMVAGVPGFADAVARRTGQGPVIEPVELVGLAEPELALASPAGLLRADAATAPFRGRPELAALLDWCADTAWSGVRLIVGPGGQGKTRLARHLAAHLAHEGWATLIVGEQASPEALTGLAEIVVPTLVVIDYAEGRATQLDPLLAAVDRAETRTRVLLLARTAGAWRTERQNPAAHLAVLGDDRIVLELSPVEPEPAGRQEAWRDAVTAFAKSLAALPDYRHLPWAATADTIGPPALGGDGYRTILAVQMDALAALLEATDPIAGGTGGRDTPQVLLEHEARYWTRVADRYDIGLRPAGRRHLVAAATLWGAATADDAYRLVTDALPRADPDTVANVADWLATLYRDGQRFCSGLHPDPLAEYLIGTTPLPTIEPTGRTVEQLEHGLTVLGRAHPAHPHLIEVIATVVAHPGAGGVDGAIAAIVVAPQLTRPQPVLDALHHLVVAADMAQLRGLSDALPHASLLLSPTSFTVAATLVQGYRQAAARDRDAYLPDLAISLNNLATHLAEIGRRAEGLSVAQEAVGVRRELVELDRDAYLPDLAISLHNLATHLAENGRRAEGLSVAQEAVELRRELVELDRDAYLPDLALSLDNLAVRLAEAGRRAEGLDAAQEGVDLYRVLVGLNHDAHVHDLALSLDNLAIRLSEAGRRPKGLIAAQEAADVCRELVGLNRDAYLPDLAKSLSTLAGRLAEAGRRGEGLDAVQEAADLYRELVGLNRDAYLPALAISLNNLAIDLAAAGRWTEGLTTAQEAVDLCRELVGLNRDAYLPNLAMSLYNLAIPMAKAGRRPEALTAAQEAADLYRGLAVDEPDSFGKRSASAEARVQQLAASNRSRRSLLFERLRRITEAEPKR